MNKYYNTIDKLLLLVVYLGDKSLQFPYFPFFLTYIM